MEKINGFPPRRRIGQHGRWPWRYKSRNSFRYHCVCGAKVQSNIKRILIRGPNWVGDSVLAVPAMKAVRAQFPDVEITLLVRPWVAGVFTSAPFVNHVWSEPRPKGLSEWRRITRAIRDRNFDLAIL